MSGHEAKCPNPSVGDQGCAFRSQLEINICINTAKTYFDMYYAYFHFSTFIRLCMSMRFFYGLCSMFNVRNYR